MEKRTLIALGLSFLVLAFYPMILQKFYPDYKPGASKVQKALTTSSAISTSTGQVAVSGAVTPAEPTAFGADTDFPVETPRARLFFNTEGGAIRQIDFLNFKNEETKKPLSLFSLTRSNEAPLFVQLLDKPAPKEVYLCRVEPASSGVALNSISSEGLKITKEFKFKNDGYGSDFSVSFENTSNQSMEFRYRLLAGSSFSPRNSIDSQYNEANFYSSSAKSPLRHIKEYKPGKTVVSEGPVDWVAIKDRHFSVIVKPKTEKIFSGFTEGLGDHRLSASLVSQIVTVPAHTSVSHDFFVYMGPTDIEELTPYGLDPIINFGKLDLIGKLLVGGLEMLHKVFRNYGLAIIALTILINIVLFPLTRASYMSMKRMQLIQPQMARLKEQNKKNPERMNKEMMELYKKHKVNPFGGCVPMLLQMPVFMALYVALSKAVILVNAKFLWIGDLSSPDKIYLPTTLPFIGNNIHLLPVIMSAAMFFQQKFTQIKMENQDPTMEAQQKMMSTMMPIIFLFIFYTMPSGLVLYWLTNTLLMTLYQLRLKNLTLA